MINIKLIEKIKNLRHRIGMQEIYDHDKITLRDIIKDLDEIIKTEESRQNTQKIINIYM